MAITQYCARAVLQSNTGHEDLGAARHATRTLTHRHALNEQNYKRAQRALAGQALRAARLHGTRQLNADEVIGARQPIGASAVQGRGIHTWKMEKKTNEAGAEAPAGVNPFACWRSCRAPQQIVEHFSTSYMAEVPW